MTDDAALARALARAGWRIAFVDGDGARRGADVRVGGARRGASGAARSRCPTSRRRAWQAADLAVVWLAMALPVLRAAAGRADAARPRAARRCASRCWRRSAGAYTRRGAPFWLSPLADPATAVRLTLSALRPARTWRGRTYRERRTAAPMSAHQRAGRHHVLDRVGGELDRREREHADARAPLEARRRGDRGAQREADRARRAGRARTRRRRTSSPPCRRGSRRRAGTRGRPSRPRRRRTRPTSRRARARRGRRASALGAVAEERGRGARGRRAARARSTRRGCRRRSRRRSTPWRRATSSATGIEPSR